MNAAVAAVPYAGRGAGVSCLHCRESRPAAHLHCFVCGRRLGVPSGRWARLQGVAAWTGWAYVRRLTLSLSRRAPDTASRGPGWPAQRTWGDHVARWYAVGTLVVAALWLAGGGAARVSAAGAAPTAACTWLDTQRVQWTDDLARATEPQRGALAGQLAALAARLGPSSRPA